MVPSCTSSRPSLRCSTARPCQELSAEIALQSRDSALVSVSDPKELATVRDGFAAKKLGLAPEAADAGMKAAAEKMKAERNKSRVTFYYLLAEATDTLAKLG